MIEVGYTRKGTPFVWASALHQELNIGTPLSVWFPRMIEYGFTENVDYSQHNKTVKMIIRHKLIDKVEEKSYRSWDLNVVNKDNYHVEDWGDLVMGREIERDGTKRDWAICDRDHMVRMIESNPSHFDYRELSKSEWRNLKSRNGKVKPAKNPIIKNPKKYTSIIINFLKWLIPVLISIGILYFAWKRQ